MKNKIIIHGLKRSGNHAIINWLKHHEDFYFFNNIIPIGAILLGTKNLKEPENFNDWFRRKALPRHLPFASLLMRPFIRKRSVIISIEDHSVEIKPFLDLPNEFCNVLILRDPYNLFSSRIRKASLVNHPAYPNHPGPGMDRALNLWKSHAREYLGQTDTLKNKVCIYYNEWFTNREYRENISKKLNLKFTDDGYSMVSTTGGGSSFDSTNFDGKSNQMNVLDRMSELSLKERELWEATIDDPELQSLALQVANYTKVSFEHE